MSCIQRGNIWCLVLYPRQLLVHVYPGLRILCLTVVLDELEDFPESDVISSVEPNFDSYGSDGGGL